MRLFRRALRESWISRGGGAAELAAQIGVPAENIERTIEEFSNSCELSHNAPAQPNR